MAYYTWQYANSRIPLDYLATAIQTWTQSGGYIGTVKKKKTESILIISKGPGAWKGKVKLTISGSPQFFKVQLDTGVAPFEAVAKVLPQVIQQYSGATVYAPPAIPQIPTLQPPPAAAPQWPQPAAQPRPQPAAQPRPQPAAQPKPQPAAQPLPPPPAPAQPPTPACPLCKKEATYITEYQRWYCYDCQKYL